jgi:hypothetical protein
MSIKPISFATSTTEWAHAGLAQEELACASRLRRNVPMLLGFTLGFASFAAIGYLFGVTPAAEKDWFLLGSLASAGLGILVAGRLDQNKGDWEINYGNHIHTNKGMDSWGKCPGGGQLYG